MKHRRISRVASLCHIALGFSLFAQVAQATMAIPGQFNVGENGTANYSIAVQAPPGVAGLEPKLSLGYNSDGGNGLLGVGWAMNGLSSIARCPKTKAQDGYNGPINHDGNDVFCLDGQRLIALNGAAYGANGTEYRTERDSFAKIVSYASGSNASYWSGPLSFKVWTKSGQEMEYGGTQDSRIESPGALTVNRVWALNKIKDTKGNYLSVSYVEDMANGECYPARIDYTGNEKTGQLPFNSIRFEYAPRPDISTFYAVGSMLKSTVRLSNIKTYAGDMPVMDYRLGYNTDPQTYRSVLATVKQCEGKTGTCLPPTSFTWQYQTNGFTAARWETQAGGFSDGQQWFSADVNGDGRSDLINMFNDGGKVSIDVHLNTGGTFSAARWISLGGAFAAGQRTFTADVNNDGNIDIINVVNDGGAATMDVYVSDGARYVRQQWAIRSGGFWDEQIWQVADFNGDGRADLVNIFAENGQANMDVHLNTGTAFALQRWATATGAITTTDRWFIADANGDGRSDIYRLYQGPTGMDIQVYGNNGTNFVVRTPFETKRGFWSSQKWFVADMNGDGKVDFINVFDDNGQASVDVHLTTGTTFKSERWMTQRGGFWDEQRWFVADVNGDGRADLINLFDDAGQASIDVHLSSNSQFQSGRWETRAGGYWAGQKWMVADVKGDGGAQLVNVFNDNGLASVDVHANAATPEDRIADFINGLGEKHTVKYAPLTNATVYTKDTGANAAIHPNRDLQIPTYVVSSVDSSNGVGGTNKITYRYGGLKTNIDGRGLLGFGWVETTKVETGLVTRVENRQDWPYIGQPSRIQTSRTAAGVTVMLSDVTNTYDCIDPATGGTCFPTALGKRYFPFVKESIESRRDLDGSMLPTVTTLSQYDNWGNPTQITVSASDGYAKTTENTYNNDAVNWFLGRLTRAKVTSTTP